MDQRCFYEHQLIKFCQDTNVEVPDSTFKIEVAIDEDALMQETCELREEKVDITKTVMVLKRIRGGRGGHR